MQKLHQSLDQQLGQLETERVQVAESVIEVQRRIDILKEVMSWDPPEEAADQDQAGEEFPLGLDSQEEFPLADLPLEEESHNPDAEGNKIVQANS